MSPDFLDWLDWDTALDLFRLVIEIWKAWRTSPRKRVGDSTTASKSRKRQKKDKRKSPRQS